MATQSEMKKIAVAAKDATTEMANADTGRKNKALEDMARLLVDRSAEIIAENRKDVTDAKRKGLSAAMIDRLTLNAARIDEMAKGLLDVVALPDPVGEITGMWRRPNGLLVGQMRIPLGVILLIYEARPNVTADAAGLCVKSGNAAILRGGSESLRSNLAVGEVLREALSGAELPENAVQVVPTADRAAIDEMLTFDELIDLVIPRGGEGLIRRVVEKSRIPVLKHYKGVCHVFVDVNADMKMAEEICYNAKVQRPGVCNAMETLLVHREIASEFLPGMARIYQKAGVELRGCPRTVKILPKIKKATEKDWPEEYLDLILAVKVVDSVDEAMEHIRKYGSNHTESIVTRDYRTAARWASAPRSAYQRANCMLTGRWG
jgi:glutamate-5-semialdehyde dehydrogenase